MKKTYQIKGMLEWHLAVVMDGVTVRIRFSGGSMGINGVTPARFTTDNLALQHLIENSHEFKEEIVKLVT